MVVGLTGGIAAGKSTVARMLVELGAELIDADDLARLVVRPGSDALAQIVQAFGASVLDERGELDRARVADVVFTDEPARRRLEAITHAAIAQAFQQRLSELSASAAVSGAPMVVYEAALLVETSRYREMDVLVVVVANDPLRIQRLMQRDGLSRQQAEARLSAQLPQSRKADLADFVVDNSGSLDQTRRQVDELWAQLTRRANV